MGSLPKHLLATPSLIHCDIRLIIDGGDVRQDAMIEILAAMETAFNDGAEKHGLDSCFSRMLKSTDSKRMRLSLRKKGFRVPLESPRKAVAVDPVDGVVTT